MGDRWDSGLAPTMWHRPSSERVLYLCEDGNYYFVIVVVVVYRKLAAHDLQSQLAVHVAMDMLVVIDDLSEYHL